MLISDYPKGFAGCQSNPQNVSLHVIAARRPKADPLLDNSIRCRGRIQWDAHSITMDGNYYTIIIAHKLSDPTKQKKKIISDALYVQINGRVSEA